jgi:hypothetical protein
VPVLDGLFALPVAFMVRRDGLPLLRNRFENHHSSMICAVYERRRGCSGSKIPGSWRRGDHKRGRWKIDPSYQEEYTLFNPGGSIVVAGYIPLEYWSDFGISELISSDEVAVENPLGLRLNRTHTLSIEALLR